MNETNQKNQVGGATGEGERDGERWIRLSVRCPEPMEEVLANFLVEQTHRGVWLEAGRVTAYCRQGPEAEACLRRLRRYYGGLRELHPGLPELEVVHDAVAQEDWGRAWKRFFKPLGVGKSIVIKPSWEQFAASPGQVVVEIDPGRAFGTGGHASTALCIEVLERLLGELTATGEGRRPNLLDVGTGSGILAIVAAKLGANRALGLDLDPEALQAAAENAARNGVAEIVALSDMPLGRVAETFELVVANLTAAVLTLMADDLVRCVRPGGWLLLSGILAEQVSQVRDCFLSRGVAVVETLAREEWRALLFRRGALCAPRGETGETGETNETGKR